MLVGGYNIDFCFNAFSLSLGLGSDSKAVFLPNPFCICLIQTLLFAVRRMFVCMYTGCALGPERGLQRRGEAEKCIACLLAYPQDFSQEC
jgi:hypothetical protein